MNLRIQRECLERGVTRICHFTPSRNFSHILAGQQGILSTARLTADERAVFNNTDAERLDGFTDFICCSIEYPNPFYFAIARNTEVLFRDWVVLLIRPDYLWSDGTRFCQINAATARGARVTTGENGFLSLYAPSVATATRVVTRSFFHPECCPTDLQAEVLVPDNIARRDVLGVAFRSEQQARVEMSRLRLAGLGVDGLEFVICEDLFRRELSDILRAGRRPAETVWIPEN